MSKHHHRNESSGFNIGDLLKNIDISQLMSIISSMGGLGGLGGSKNDNISSMLNGLNLGDLGKNSGEGLNDSNIKSKLSSLENRLANLENRNQLQNDLLEKVRELQRSPDAAKYLNQFMGSNDNKRHN